MDENPQNVNRNAKGDTFAKAYSEAPVNMSDTDRKAYRAEDTPKEFVDEIKAFIDKETERNASNDMPDTGDQESVEDTSDEQDKNEDSIEHLIKVLSERGIPIPARFVMQALHANHDPIDSFVRSRLMQKQMAGRLYRRQPKVATFEIVVSPAVLVGTLVLGGLFAAYRFGKRRDRVNLTEAGC